MVVISREDGTVIARRAVVADSSASRIGGWMFRTKPDDDEAMFIPACFSVHTCFVRFRIDIVFLDENGGVLSVRPEVPPWRAVAHFRADSVLELPAGRARETGLTVGQRLVLEATS